MLLTKPVSGFLPLATRPDLKVHKQEKRLKQLHVLCLRRIPPIITPIQLVSVHNQVSFITASCDRSSPTFTLSQSIPVQNVTMFKTLNYMKLSIYTVFLTAHAFLSQIREPTPSPRYITPQQRLVLLSKYANKIEGQ